jgi:serine/threonine protein kinase
MMAPENPTRLLNCPTPDALRAYDAGRLAPAAMDVLAAHLERCGPCLRSLQALSGAEADPLVAGLRGCSAAPALAEDEARRAVALVEALADPDATVLPPARRTEPGVATRPCERVGPYELLEPLGQGGMGSVHKARHVHLNKIVALKLLLAERMASAGARERFLREIKAVGSLPAHPHIIQAYDAAVEELPYLVMEYVAGTDLAHLVKDRSPLPVADACELVRQAALGLQHAHEHGRVHRDIKPSNLMLTTSGQVKVLDLGLALFQEAEPSETALTAAGTVMGTPDYMAPEQLLDSHSVDIRADIYSLGCTLYHLLVGRPPFNDEKHVSVGSKRLAHLSEPPPPIRTLRPEVPVALAGVLERLTAKEPADRYATPAEVAAALAPFTAGCNLVGQASSLPGLRQAGSLPHETAVPTPGCTSPRTLMLPQRRQRLRWPWIAAAVLLGVGLAVLLFVLDRSEPLRVDRFEVRHYQQKADGVLALPSVGGPGFTGIRFDDRVRIGAVLSEPAYCYLIAFNPDGRDQLCWPSGDQAEPQPVKELLYPEGDVYFRLNDGVGLQAFVLLASRRPLPAYADWKATVGALPWTKADGGGVWRYDGRSFHPLESGRRGQEEKLPVPAAFAELCRFLREHSGGDTIEAVAFPVRPEKR